MSRDRARRGTAGEDPLLEELAALYARVDALFQGASCDASTECCRFGVTGREPQLTSIELAMLVRALRARGGPLPEKRRALPLALEHARTQAERTCPLLDRSGKCAVYAARPLGCRTFFCARASVPAQPARAELTAVVRALQELSARHQRDGDKPRALTRALV